MNTSDMYYSENRAAVNKRNNQPYPMYKIRFADYAGKVQCAYYNSFVRAIKRFRFERECGLADIIRTDDPQMSCLFV